MSVFSPWLKRFHWHDENSQKSVTFTNHGAIVQFQTFRQSTFKQYFRKIVWLVAIYIPIFLASLNLLLSAVRHYSQFILTSSTQTMQINKPYTHHYVSKWILRRQNGNVIHWSTQRNIFMVIVNCRTHDSNDNRWNRNEVINL